MFLVNASVSNSRVGDGLKIPLRIDHKIAKRSHKRSFIQCTYKEHSMFDQAEDDFEVIVN